jgi:hypothetical protein
MFSTFTTIALLATGAAGLPTWQTDYGIALKTASAQQKPIAVFIGKGEAGYAKVVGGSIPTDAGQLLAKNYVCVYVNTETTAGQKLAGQFDISKGIVISGKGGSVQALRYAGNVTPLELTGYLNKYSGTETVSTTETAGAATIPATAVYGSSCANGRCGTPVYSSYPAFSSCPNGRCPNAR